jgi:hypothetical protein
MMGGRGFRVEINEVEVLPGIDFYDKGGVQPHRAFVEGSVRFFVL